MPRLGSVEWLALQSGLPARLQHDPALVRYATRTRRARRWIVVGGLVVVMISDLVFDSHGGPVLGFPTSLVPAWFAARIIPDLVVRNRAIGAVRVAGLSARSPTRYVVPTARRWLLGSFALALAGVVLSRGPASSWQRRRSDPGLGGDRDVRITRRRPHRPPLAAGGERR